MEKKRTREDDRLAIVRWRLLAIVSAAVFLLSCWLLLDSLLAITQSDEGINVTVPDFRGLHEDAIAFEDWMESESEYRYAEAVRKGVVISQVPAPGTQRKLSAQHPTCRIKLVISLGPKPQDGGGN